MLRANCLLGQWSGEPGCCQLCGHVLPETGRRRSWCSDACRRAFERNHIWRRARAAARRRGKYRCSWPGGCTTGDNVLEVHHVEPVSTNGYGVGCQHHQSNLALLCHTHHVQVTVQERKQRKMAATGKEA